MNKIPLLAIIVVGTNERKWIGECFRSIFASSYSNQITIYVDNASIDGSVEAVRTQFSAVRIIENVRNMGYAGANNRGIAEALLLGADYLLILNPDTRISSDTAEGLVGFMMEHSSYGIIGPMQAQYGDVEGGHKPNGWTRHALENGERHVFHHWLPHLHHEAGSSVGRSANTLEHAYVQGAALAISAAVIREIGLFDPTYQTFYEEVDLCRRARWAGYRVALLSNLWIEHAGGSEGPPSAYRTYYMVRNKFLYMLTDPKMSRREKLRLMAMWIAHDVFIQIPHSGAAAVGYVQYARAWISIIGLSRHIVRTYRLNRIRVLDGRSSNSNDGGMNGR